MDRWMGEEKEREWWKEAGKRRKKRWKKGKKGRKIVYEYGHKAMEGRRDFCLY